MFFVEKGKILEGFITWQSGVQPHNCHRLSPIEFVESPRRSTGSSAWHSDTGQTLAIVWFFSGDPKHKSVCLTPACGVSLLMNRSQWELSSGGHRWKYHYVLFYGHCNIYFTCVHWTVFSYDVAYVVSRLDAFSFLCVASVWKKAHTAKVHVWRALYELC